MFANLEPKNQLKDLQKAIRLQQINDTLKVSLLFTWSGREDSNLRLAPEASACKALRPGQAALRLVPHPLAVNQISMNRFETGSQRDSRVI